MKAQNTQENISSRRMPLLSILISCYNQENFVRTCMTSFFHQDYPEIEMLVWDDGSTDGSFPVIQETATDAPFPVRVGTWKNAGVARVFEHLAEEARGEFLLFCAADDFVPPNSLAGRMNHLLTDSRMFLAGGNARFFENGMMGDLCYSAKKMERLNRFPPKFFLEKVIRRCQYKKYGMILLPAAILRNSAYRAVGGFEKGMIGDDTVLMYKLFKKAGESNWTFHIDRDVVFYYRIHENNTHRVQHLRMWRIFSELYTHYHLRVGRPAASHAAAMVADRLARRGNARRVLQAAMRDPAISKVLFVQLILWKIFRKWVPKKNAGKKKKF